MNSTNSMQYSTAQASIPLSQSVNKSYDHDKDHYFSNNIPKHSSIVPKHSKSKSWSWYNWVCCILCIILIISGITYYIANREN